MQKDNLHKSLVNFLRYFIGRPNHLAKYLLENNALDSKFLNNLEKNKNFSSTEEKSLDIYFIDINQMNNFFNSLMTKNSNLDLEDLKSELNRELEVCLKEERYEDAIRIRDYLKKITNNSH